jgi:hypothetical protein
MLLKIFGYLRTSYEKPNLIFKTRRDLRLPRLFLPCAPKKGALQNFYFATRSFLISESHAILP